MKGWADYLEVEPAQRSGVYGSAAGTYIPDFASNGNPPDFIWFAEVNSTGASTRRSNYIPSTMWIYNQRHKQYALNVTETYGGVSINIDRDCSDGPVYSSVTRLNGSSICIA